MLHALHSLIMRYVDARRCLMDGQYHYTCVVTSVLLNTGNLQVCLSLSLAVSWHCFHAKPYSSRVFCLFLTPLCLSRSQHTYAQPDVGFSRLSSARRHNPTSNSTLPMLVRGIAHFALLAC